jgi:hypothetical protein
MPRLVTGLFYERGEAERAVEALKAAGVPAESIYLEREVDPASDIGRKGGEVGRGERERRIAGLESGVIIGLACGLLAGIGVGLMGTAITEVERATSPGSPAMSPFGTNPWVAALLGALAGTIAGALIGWVVDYTLNRMGAGPARPMEETLVTVRTDAASVDSVYAALFKARARHLHVAESAVA